MSLTNYEGGAVSNYNNRGAIQFAADVYNSLPEGSISRLYNSGSNMVKRFRNKKNPSFRRPTKRPRTMSRRSVVGNGRGVTTQHDTTNVYRKRRMPKRKRRGWAKFTRKVHAVAEKELGSRTVVFNSQPTFYNSNPLNHGIAHVALYSALSNLSYTYLSDLSELVKLENQASPTAALGGTIDKTTKFLFQSAVMDLTMRNTSGGYEVGGAETLNSNMALEVDVYDISSPIMWDGNASVLGLPSLLEVFNLGNTDTKDIGGAATGIEISKRGVTPFECCQTLSRWRLKINSKKKYFIPSGATATYQIRDPKRRTTVTQNLERLTGCNKPGWTRHIFIVFKSVPGTLLSPIAPVLEVLLKIGLTRIYMYKIEGFNDTRDRYFTNYVTNAFTNILALPTDQYVKI